MFPRRQRDTRAETRMPQDPTPSPSATNTSRPSDGSTTIRTPAHRPSSRTSQDDGPSAESQGHATKPAETRGGRRVRTRRQRRHLLRTRTRDTPPPLPRTGPSPDRRQPAPPSPDTPYSRGKHRQDDAARRRRGARSPATAAPPDAPPPAPGTRRSGTEPDTLRIPRGSCCSRSTARTRAPRPRWSAEAALVVHRPRSAELAPPGARRLPAHPAGAGLRLMPPCTPSRRARVPSRSSCVFLLASDRTRRRS